LPKALKPVFKVYALSSVNPLDSYIPPDLPIAPIAAPPIPPITAPTGPNAIPAYAPAAAPLPTSPTVCIATYESVVAVDLPPIRLDKVLILLPIPPIAPPKPVEPYCALTLLPAALRLLFQPVFIFD